MSKLPFENLYNRLAHPELKPRRRRKWWWWFLKVPAILVLILLVTYFTWSWRTKAAWNREMERLAAAGEWVTVNDLNTPVVLKGPNYAEPLLRAIALSERESQENRAVSDYEHPDDRRRYPLTDRGRKILGDYVAASQDALACLDEASGRTEVDWQRTYVSPLMLADFPDRRVRKVANIADYDATLLFDSGKHRQAFARWEQIYELGERYGENPTVMDYLIAMGVQQIAVYQFRQTASGLKIGEGDDEVRREDVEQMIRQLLDRNKPDARFVRAMRTEMGMKRPAAVTIAQFN